MEHRCIHYHHNSIRHRLYLPLRHPPCPAAHHEPSPPEAPASNPPSPLPSLHGDIRTTPYGWMRWNQGQTHVGMGTWCYSMSPWLGHNMRTAGGVIDSQIGLTLLKAKCLNRAIQFTLGIQRLQCIAGHRSRVGLGHRPVTQPVSSIRLGDGSFPLSGAPLILHRPSTLSFIAMI